MRSATFLAAGAGAAALATAACGSAASGGSGGSASGPETLSGAGSTLAAPVYQTWGSQLKDRGITLNYQPVGSGDGVAAFTQGTVDFAATDPPLKPSEAAAIPKSPPRHIPTVFGAITVSYNLPGVRSGLKLDGPTVADIYLGKVRTWNDPAIARLNPGLKLPAQPITVVHRSDSSGTTKGFTTFLAAHSPAWTSQVGAGKDVKWPTGTGAKGNSGVASAVKQEQGSVGYVEQAYALQNGFTYASVKNRAGTFVAPTLASTSAAGEGISVPSSLELTAIDSPNPKAYPIVSQTFIVVHGDLCKGGMTASQAKAMKQFLDYGLGQGQQDAQKISYAPLPPSLKTKAQRAVDALTCNGKPVS